jgi:hypothetical protein
LLNRLHTAEIPRSNVIWPQFAEVWDLTDMDAVMRQIRP